MAAGKALTISEIMKRGVPPNKMHARTPEHLAELEALYQCIQLAKTSRELGLELLKLRLEGIDWRHCYDRLLGHEQVT